jgi:hypothetical protein
MKKDINIPEVKNITVTIVRKKNDLNEYIWDVYLMNSNNHAIENILIVSHGYGVRDGEQVKTSTLRHFFEKLDSHSSMVTESIDPSIFILNNEFGITFYIDGMMHFKKFTFVAGSISEEFLTSIPVLRMEGVVHS